MPPASCTEMVNGSQWGLRFFFTTSVFFSITFCPFGDAADTIKNGSLLPRFPMPSFASRLRANTVSFTPSCPYAPGGGPYPPGAPGYMDGWYIC